MHAKLSPSSAHRWLACPGSVVLESRCPDTSSAYADEGTAAHELAAKCLTQELDASSFVGSTIRVGDTDYKATLEMAEHVQLYIDYVRSFEGELLVEQEVPVSRYTGEAGAVGTSDAVIVDGRTITIIDLKYGRGVKVEAERNPQLMLYALGSCEELEYLGDFTNFRFAIVQPRKLHISEWECAYDDLYFFAGEVEEAAEAVRAAEYAMAKDPETQYYLRPGERQCKFCRAKAICPALRDYVLETVAGDFVDLDVPIRPQLEGARVVDNHLLGELLSAVDLIEDWCRAIRARAEEELMAGREVPGYKLVEGRKGPRKWADEKAVEDALKAAGLQPEAICDFSLISPTTAEKRVKAGVIDKGVWEQIQDLIVRKPGKPAVVPVSDKRPALQSVACDFEEVGE